MLCCALRVLGGALWSSACALCRVPCCSIGCALGCALCCALSGVLPVVISDVLSGVLPCVLCCVAKLDLRGKSVEGCLLWKQLQTLTLNFAKNNNSKTVSVVASILLLCFWAHVIVISWASQALGFSGPLARRFSGSRALGLSPPSSPASQSLSHSAPQPPSL